MLASRSIALARLQIRYASEMRTPLYSLHVELGAKLVPFCGWEMPVQYKEGVLKSHLHTRKDASLFDVAHMGQLRITGKDRVAFVESITVADVEGYPFPFMDQRCISAVLFFPTYLALKPDQARLSSFTTSNFGIIDDCMVTKRDDHLYMVINAGCFDKDMVHIRGKLAEAKQDGFNVDVHHITTTTLIALQGPKAASVLQKLAPSIKVSDLAFMYQTNVSVGGADCLVTRCGYTGEDGFEIAIPNKQAIAVCRLMLADPAVLPAGLGARDSLRLEAGLCLYGHDLDETCSPIEAGLLWTITKRRREKGGFPGYETFLNQMKAGGVSRKRVGILSDVPAREHTEIQSVDGKVIGEINSGTMSPILKKGVAMGYVASASSAIDTPLKLLVRGKLVDAKVVKLPFVATQYYKKL